MTDDIADHNRAAWDKLVEEGDRWTVPVSAEMIAAARVGEWAVYLAEEKPTPRHWFPQNMHGVDVLCLASGGGQQAPILAAAGANVVSYDNSPGQLRQDELLARREGLSLRTVQGDMRDLGVFAGATFDLIFHPVSNIFVPDVLPVWRECYRVLRPGGTLLMGTVNPIEYAFDRVLMDREGLYQLKYALPYSDTTDITEAERVALYGNTTTYEFSHTLTDYIGGQLDAGFIITGFFEAYRDDPNSPRFFPPYLVTRAVKL